MEGESRIGIAIATAATILMLSFVWWAVNGANEPVLVHEYDDLSLFHACSYYRLDNFNRISSFSPETVSLQSHRDVAGKLLGGSWEFEHVRIETVRLPYEDCAEVPDGEYANKTARYRLECKTFYRERNESMTYWLPYEDFSAVAGDYRAMPVQRVRYCSKVIPDIGAGLSYSIDIVPRFDGIAYSHLNWWNLSFSKRMPIDINVSDGSTLGDYSVFLNITYDSDMQADFDDLRFASNCSADALELGYCLGRDCIADNTNNASAEFAASSYAEAFVRVFAVNSTICMYYGNAGAGNKSSFEDAFKFADDFNDNSINATKWGRGCDAQFQEGGGMMNVTLASSANKWCWSWYNATWGDLAETYYYLQSNAGHIHMPLGYKNAAGDVFFTDYVYTNNHYRQYWSPGADAVAITAASATTWYNVRTFVQLNTTTSLYDSFTQVNGTKSPCDANITVAGGKGFTLNAFSSGSVFFWDYVRIRGYHVPEPVATFSSEESPSSVPQVNIASPLNQTYSYGNQTMLLNWTAGTSLITANYSVTGSGNISLLRLNYSVTGSDSNGLSVGMSGDGDHHQMYGVRMIFNDTVGISAFGFKPCKFSGYNPTGNITISIRDFATKSTRASIVYGDASLAASCAGGMSGDGYLRWANFTPAIEITGDLLFAIEYNGTRGIYVGGTTSGADTDIVYVYDGQNSTYNPLSWGTTNWNVNLSHALNFTPANTTFSPLQGSNTLTVYASAGGGMNSTSVSFYVDTALPSFSGWKLSAQCTPNPGVVSVSWDQSDNLDDLWAFCNFTSPSSAVTSINATNQGNDTQSSCSKALTEVGQWAVETFLQDMAGNRISSTGSVNVVSDASLCSGQPTETPNGGGGSSPLTLPVNITIFVLPNCSEGYTYDMLSGRCRPAVPPNFTAWSAFEFGLFKPSLFKVAFNYTVGTDKYGNKVVATHSTYLLSWFQAIVFCSIAAIVLIRRSRSKKLGQANATLLIAGAAFLLLSLSTAVPAEAWNSLQFIPEQLSLPAAASPEIGYNPPVPPVQSQLGGVYDALVQNASLLALILVAIVVVAAMLYTNESLKKDIRRLDLT